MWTPASIRLLIDQRKNRNDFGFGRNKKDFWRSVSRRINRVAGTNYTHRQCSWKWASLVSLILADVHIFIVCCKKGRKNLPYLYFNILNKIHNHVISISHLK